MKTAAIIIVMLGLVGCASTPPKPAPGAATLRVKVVGDPKEGYSTANYHVRVYDAATSGAYGYGGGGGGRGSSSANSDFEKVDYAALDEVVIWVEPVGDTAVGAGGANLSPVHVEVDPQKAADRLAAAVAVGQKIILENHGSKAGTVYSVSDENNFHLGEMSPGGSGEYVVKSPGLIEVVTTSLEEPMASVYAAPTRWVKLTKSGRSIDFTDLPPGQYKVVSWHPRLPGHETTVRLTADNVTKASIEVGVNGLPKVGP